MIAPSVPNQEAARLEALRRLGILHTPPEERFDQLTRAAMLALHAPMASISLIDEETQWCKSSPGMEKPEIDRSISFCGHTILQAPPLVVADATKDERFHDNPLVVQSAYLRSYLGVPLLSEDGHRIGSFCVLDTKPREFTPEQVQLMRDLASVAERELQNVALNRSLEEARVAHEEAAAEAKAKAKGALLAVMSHEIRTPLNGVLGVADILAGTPLSDDQREYVDLIRASGNMLLTLINDILDFSKIEAGKVELEFLTIHLRTFLRETLAIQAHAAKAKGIVLDSHVDSSVSEYILGDACRLRQILINLVGNALKFTDKGEVCVVVRLAESDGHTKLLFQVRDTGIGIEPDHLQRLFKPFVQAESSTARRYGGTGLGLWICKLLVELMGGAIQAQSVPGQGATFSFEIPYLPSEAMPDRSTAPGACQPHAQYAKHAGLQILIVEDNPINQRVTALFLAKLGFQANCVSDGNACLRTLEEKSYDLILMDVQMPGMDGYETTRRIRDRAALAKRQPWIVAVTASTEEQTVANCLKAGMNDFLGKPMRLSDLEHVLQRFEQLR